MSLGEGAGHLLPHSDTGRHRSRPSNPGLRAERRLDGWKEIAAHFAKGERTVKRWEADRGLPVHRVPGGGRATVYAVAAELNAWLESNRTVALEAVERASPAPDGTHSEGVRLQPTPVIALSEKTSAAAEAGPTRWAWWTAIGLLVVFVAAASYQLTRRATPLAGAGTVMAPRKSAASDADSAADVEKKTARDLYLKGRFEWNQRTPESLSRSLDDFTASLLHDPASAPTYAALADTYILLREYSLIPAREAYRRAIEAATQAVDLDDTLAEAHRSLAFAEVWGKWDFQAGKREFLRALELNPNDALTHLWFATAFKAPEWHSFTAAEFQRAQELDPTSTVVLTNKSTWLFETGQRQEGIDLARQVERADADFLAPHRYLAKMAWTLRDYEQFLLEADLAARLQHDTLAQEANAAARAGYRRDGERGLLNDLYEVRQRQVAAGTLAGARLAEVCIRLGKNDEALQLLRKDFEERRPEFLDVLSNPDLRLLKDDPRYQELVGKLDIPQPPSHVF